LFVCYPFFPLLSLLLPPQCSFVPIRLNPEKAKPRFPGGLHFNGQFSFAPPFCSAGE